MALNSYTEKIRSAPIEKNLGSFLGKINPYLDFVGFFSPIVIFQNIFRFQHEFVSLKNYLVSTLVLLLTLIVILVFGNFVQLHPYFFLTAAVIINALYGGIGAALYSIIAGVVIANLVTNNFHLSQSDLRLTPVDITFILDGLLVTWISLIQKRKQQQTTLDLLQEQDARLKAQNTSLNLRRLERQKDDFIAIAAHELKNPLASIKAFTQLLETKIPPEQDAQIKHYLEKLEEQTNRLDDLVTQLFDVSNMSAGQIKLKKTPVNFDELILATIIDLQHTIETHKLVIEGHTKSQVTLDPDRVREVVINLVTNAVKYSPQADKVIIKLNSEKKSVVFSVEDFGSGINPDNQKRIFERFYRVQSYQVSGLGLGLYIASEIIKLHKGKIWLSSTVPEGSTFYFSIPKDTQQFDQSLTN